MLDVSGVRMEGTQEQRRDTSTDPNNNRNSQPGEKYGLRPRTIIKRLQQEIIRKEVPKKPPRCKSRPPPLSKYRRKTANARERHRMREINNAFESLRKVLPDAMEVHASSSSMTKITTLRLAVAYIRALSHVLDEAGQEDLCSIQNTLQNSIQDSLQNTLQHSLQHTFQYSLQVTPTSGNVTTLHHQYSTSSLAQEQFPQLLGYCSTYSAVSGTSSPSTDRKSLSSGSDIDELLSDDSGLLEDSLDVFHDIPTIPVADPFDILLVAERDGLPFTAELCN